MKQNEEYMENLAEVVQKALAQVAQITDETALENMRVEYLGKKGYFTELMKGLGKLSADRKSVV